MQKHRSANGIAANVLWARWRFADVRKHCSANKTVVLALQCFWDSIFAVAAQENQKSDAVVTGTSDALAAEAARVSVEESL